jgi:hypothetical protein
MLCLIPIAGGLLIMMGQHDRSEALFYYFRLEDQVPETHLLRLIEKHISFEFVRERLKDSYSEMGRPSIDPELLLRILLIGYLYGVTSERKLVEELRMHLAPFHSLIRFGSKNKTSQAQRSESSAGPCVIAMLYAASRSGKESGGWKSSLSAAGFTLMWNDARSRASFGPITLVSLSTVVLKSLACTCCNSTVIVMSNNPPSRS